MRIGIYHLNQVGDFLFSLPFLKSLRTAHPDATIEGFLPKNLISLAAHSPYFTDTTIRPEGRDIGFWELLKTKKYDWWISLSASPKSYFTAKRSGAKRRSGFKRPFLTTFLTESVPYRHPFNLENVQRLRDHLGLPNVGDDYRGMLSFSPEFVKQEENRWKGTNFSEIVALSPGSSGHRPEKHWPEERYASLIPKINRMGYQPMLIGSPKEKENLEQIREESGNRAINLAGTLSLPQLAYFLSKVRILICNDSGAMHLASVFETPLIALFGSTSPSQTGPHNRNSLLINCQEIKMLTVDRVLESTERILM